MVAKRSRKSGKLRGRKIKNCEVLRIEMEKINQKNLSNILVFEKYLKINQQNLKNILVRVCTHTKLLVRVILVKYSI